MRIKIKVSIVLGKDVAVTRDDKQRFRDVKAHAARLTRSGDIGWVIMNALEADLDEQRRIGFKMPKKGRR